MEERSFYTFCISACIFMLFINLCIIFVTSLGVFNWVGPTVLPGGTNITEIATKTTNSPSGIFSLFTGGIGNLTSIAAIAGLGGLIICTGFALFSGNWNILAVYLFTIIFWGSWSTSLVMFNIGGLFSIPAIGILIAILSVGMLFLFAGAVIGLLHLGEG